MTDFNSYYWFSSPEMLSFVFIDYFPSKGILVTWIFFDQSVEKSIDSLDKPNDNLVRC